MRKSKSPCSSPITGRQIDTCYQVICLAAGQNPYTENPFRPPGPLKSASQPSCSWIQEGDRDVTRHNHSHEVFLWGFGLANRGREVALDLMYHASSLQNVNANVMTVVVCARIKVIWKTSIASLSRHWVSEIPAKITSICTTHWVLWNASWVRPRLRTINIMRPLSLVSYK